MGWGVEVRIDMGSQIYVYIYIIYIYIGARDCPHGIVVDGTWMLWGNSAVAAVVLATGGWFILWLVYKKGLGPGPYGP
jgi:hypothetical protein